MRIDLCGVRGSTPATGAEFARHGGDTSCVALAHADGDPVLLLDAGTGLARVTALLDGRPFRGSVLLGHLHWDHTHGIPFFRAGDRDDAVVRVRLPAAPGATAEETLARVLSPPHFPITPAGLRGRWTFDDLREGRHEVEGFVVDAREIPHPGGRTLGFRISDGEHTVAYLTDHGPVALGDGPDGFGPYHDAALALARDADVLIHDAQYTAAEFARCRAFGHSSIDYALGLAGAAGAVQLVLFHHDPSRTDDQLDAIAAELPAGAVVGRQGDVIRPRVLVQ